MKIEKIIGERFKEKPSDTVLPSHAFLIRGGYIKQVSNGIYSLLPTAKRIINKIESIIRSKMDEIEGQEVLLPVVMPASLWQESGRYESIGSEMVRFTDRSNGPYVLGMTHEEAAVHLTRDYGNSYARYPFMIYQIQTKFRDEARPRGGLIRVREFTMKDGYSFHTSKADLELYYQRVYQAYHDIFRQVGLGEVVAVQSDSGMMGGSISHEFMLLADAGEDTIACCNSCNYKANMEVASSVAGSLSNKIEPLVELYTPSIKIVDQLATMLDVSLSTICKAVIYENERDDSLVIAFIRGDHEVNECKLRNLVGANLFAARAEIAGAIVTLGYVGPYHLLSNKIVYYVDQSLRSLNSLVVGANRCDYHFKGFNFERDLGDVVYHDLVKVQEGEHCPKCDEGSIVLKRGIEVGNIFQLDTKYSKLMNMNFTDEKGESHHPLMGCYGIGVGRLLASVCEVSHDDQGPIWPVAIAPWNIHLIALSSHDCEVKKIADNLYQQLQNKGYEVIYDDRNLRPGVMFADADLIGVPLRIIVSPKNNSTGVVELVSRNKAVKHLTPYDHILEAVSEVLMLLNEGSGK